MIGTCACPRARACSSVCGVAAKACCALRFAFVTIALVAGLAGAARAAGSLPALPDLPLPGEKMILHDQAGVALSGFDPVAYFDQGRAVGGLADHELQHGGVVWRFSSKANMVAFARSPEIYMPMFGGYDPVAMAGGRATATVPELFLIHDGRLVMFRNRALRAQFEQDPGILRAALRAWPAVERQLAR